MAVSPLDLKSIWSAGGEYAQWFAAVKNQQFTLPTTTGGAIASGICDTAVFARSVLMVTEYGTPD